MISDSDFNRVSQSAHLLAGALAVCATVAIFGASYKWYGAGGIIIFAAIKEFWYDYKYETPEIRGSSSEDFAFYCIGVIISLLALF